MLKKIYFVCFVLNSYSTPFRSNSNAFDLETLVFFLRERERDEKLCRKIIKRMSEKATTQHRMRENMRKKGEKGGKMRKCQKQGEKWK